jgi:hypothetical protein
LDKTNSECFSRQDANHAKKGSRLIAVTFAPFAFLARVISFPTLQCKTQSRNSSMFG